MNAPTSRATLLADARRLHAAGELAAAAACYDLLLARDPEDPEALHLSGVLRHQQGDHEGAIRTIRRALAHQPAMAPAWQNLVLPLLASEQFDEAVAAGREAIRLAPDKPGIWTNGILALIRAGRLDEAAFAAEAALAIAPESAATWSQLGHIRMAGGHADLAARLLDRALAIDPDHEEARYNRGVAAQTLMDETGAERHYRKVLERNPGHRGARLNLGVALRSQGRVAEALDIWAASEDPPETWPELAYDIACARLMQGDWRAGWPDYELRFVTTTPIVRPPRTDAPRWDGAPLPGGTLMVHHEQGLGDTIQFVRLLPALLDRVGRIAFVCQPQLCGLLSGLAIFADPSRATLHREGEPVPAHAAWTPLLSLAGILDIDPVGVPRRVPYLSVQSGRVAEWATRLDGLDGGRHGIERPFRIGLSWQGNPKAPVERGRSIPLARFAPLGEVAGTSIFALQKGHGREQAPPAGLNLIDLGPEFDAGPDAFLDTAAVMAELDLVITSDTAIAHVAGALGRPVWLLLKHVPDWRWGLSGRLTPWYPTMRLFRQSAPGDWDGVMAEVAAELSVLVSARSTPPAERSQAQAIFEAALADHRAGRVAEAVTGYRRLLGSRPQNARLLNFLGMAMLDANGRNAASARAALPFVLRSTGLDGADPDLFGNLAVVLKQAGERDEALQALDHALAIDPYHRPSHLNRINLDLAAGKGPAALERAAALAGRHPKDPSVLSALASAAKACGRLADAEGAARRAAALEPASAKYRVLLGSILAEAGRHDAAAAAWDEALAIDPRNADALSNLGVHERNHGEPALGLWYARLAVAADPRHGDAWCNLGIAAGDLERVDEARAAFAQAVALQPDHAEARMALGMNALAAGRFAEGFPDYEWRLRSERLGLGMQPGRLPPWTGGDPRGLRLLVIAEQGFGDAIQFVRYAALLKERGAAQVVVGCRRRLKALLATATGVDALVGEGERLPAADAFVPMLSLPARLGTTVETIPAPVPYLRADPVHVTRWAERLAEGDGFRVGLVWQGNPDPKVDRGRSLPLAALAPLGAVPGVRLIALQKGPGSEQIEEVASLFRVETPGPAFDEGPDAFVDTAAVLMNLDLVVTTDTAVAHLAGALGRPVWLLLKAQPEWRWLSDRNDTPWYPTMRLFRQRPGDRSDGANPWFPVVARLAAELERLVEGDRSRLIDVTPDPHDERPPPPPPARRFDEALTLHRAGRTAAARRMYAELLHDRPDHGEVLHMLGAMALQESRWTRALFLLDRAAAAGVATPEFRTNRAVALRNLGRLEEAERMARAVMDEAPSAEAALTLGNLLRDRDDGPGALTAMQEAVKRGPRLAKAHRGLGNALRDLGRMDEALLAFSRAVALDSRDADLRLDRAHALLAAGRLQDGFAEYEWRWKSAELVPHGYDAPAWTGEALPKGTLLVHGEQGLGDHIQFARFLTAALDRVGRMIVAVRRPLIGLFAALGLDPERVRIVEAGTGAMPRHDAQVPLMSLPYRLAIGPSDLPGSVPYLFPDPDRVGRWRDRIGDDGRLRVGLIWQGNPKAKADRGRSPPLASLAPVLAVEGVRFLSLQKEHGLDQLAGTPFADRIERLGPDFDAGPDAFLDSLAVMSGLDLIVTSDTAAAHLAGAAGRPTLLMLKKAPDWRWMVERPDTPWYPTVHLVRQPTAGNWSAVASAVAARLDAEVRAR